MWLGLGLATVVSVIVLAVVLALSGQSSARDKLADWVNADDCASVDNRSWPPSKFYAVPPGFARLAAERAAIICNWAGPWTYYFRFRSASVMQAALTAYPTVRRLRLCRLNGAVFTTDGLDPGWPSSFCARMHGRPLPARQTHPGR